MVKSEFTKVLLEEYLNSIPDLASDLTTVIETYATKTELSEKVSDILNQVSVVKEAGFTLVEVDEVPDITPY